MSDLDRFLKVQENSFDRVFSEIKIGKKVGHWMWYIFPQIKGLGKSYNSNYFGIDSKIETVEYLSHSILGQRIRDCVDALLPHEDKPIQKMMRGVDSMKLKSSMTLFSEVSHEECFEKVLNTFFNGEKCERTLELVQVSI